MSRLISNVPPCELCGEPDARHDVLPTGASGFESYMHVCEHCVERATNIIQWHEGGTGI